MTITNIILEPFFHGMNSNHKYEPMWTRPQFFLTAAKRSKVTESTKSHPCAFLSGLRGFGFGATADTWGPLFSAAGILSTSGSPWPLTTRGQQQPPPDATGRTLLTGQSQHALGPESR